MFLTNRGMKVTHYNYILSMEAECLSRQSYSCDLTSLSILQTRSRSTARPIALILMHHASLLQSTNLISHLELVNV